MNSVFVILPTEENTMFPGAAHGFSDVDHIRVEECGTLRITFVEGDSQTYAPGTWADYTFVAGA